mmetsp:Transcript_5838/g.13183  ORF Transcript_5838/g.13183 Transcript_5838/m.13183 type:complete len:200 (+) Transcript_5838:117-716(+)
MFLARRAFLASSIWLASAAAKARVPTRPKMNATYAIPIAPPRRLPVPPSLRTARCDPPELFDCLAAPGSISPSRKAAMRSTALDAAWLNFSSAVRVGMVVSMMVSRIAGSSAFMKAGPPVMAPSLLRVTRSRTPLRSPSSREGYHVSSVLSANSYGSGMVEIFFVVTTKRSKPVFACSFLSFSLIALRLALSTLASSST